MRRATFSNSNDLNSITIKVGNISKISGFSKKPFEKKDLWV